MGSVIGYIGFMGSIIGYVGFVGSIIGITSCIILCLCFSWLRQKKQHYFYYLLIMYLQGRVSAARGQKTSECLSIYLKKKICTFRAHYQYPILQDDNLYQT
jgi:hypothetical protein